MEVDSRYDRREDAVEAKLRSTALAKFLDEWQAEHGAFTPEEIDAAAEKLGFRPRTSGAA